MKVYRAEIHGHLVEARSTDWGGERVLVDGCVVSSKWFGGWSSSSHFFDLRDEKGRSRHVEVRWIDVSRFGLGRYRVAISVDGVERCRLEPVDPKKPPSVCHNCGYSLHGLPVENSEVRCPECGRHCSAILFDRPAGEDGIFVR